MTERDLLKGQQKAELEQGCLSDHKQSDISNSNVRKFEEY
jgi:hypothetical protein